MRRTLLLSNLATAIVGTAVVREAVVFLLRPQLQAMPSENLQAQHLLEDFTVVLLIGALALATATYLIFEWVTRRRLAAFGRQLSGVSETPGPPVRVEITPDHQMAGLAQPVNRLLGSLQSAQVELAERQQQLATSEQRLSLALEATGDGLFDYHRHGGTYCSPSYFHMLGYAVGGTELSPDNWAKLVHPDDMAATDEAIRQVRVGETSLLAVELRMRTAAGTWKWVFLRGRVTARSPEDGRPLRMIGTVQDIDSRRQAERERHENQELFRNAFQESPIGMALAQLDGSLMKVNTAFCDMLGYSEAELLAMNFQQLTFPDDLSANLTLLDALSTGRRPGYSMEKRYVRKDGKLLWAHLNVGAVLDDERRPQFMIGQIKDITERKLGESALRENQELFRNAFEESAVGMALVKPDGSLMRVNDTFCAITGYDQATLLALRFQDITHPDDLSADVEFVRSVLSGERRHYSMEKRYVRGDGTTVWVLLNVGVVLDAAQYPMYLIAQVQDITSRRQSADELHAYAQRLEQTKNALERRTVELGVKTAEAEAAKLAAEQAARTKSAFLANISHEIRTPMAAIIGFADLLQDDRLPDAERARSIETISRQGQHLLALINDILDLSKIEAGKMSVECIECDPAQIVADVEAMTAGRAIDKRLPLTIRIADGVPKRVRSDPTRLRQILLNLVSNAIKFTESGHITVDVTRVDMPGGGPGLRFVVTDTGIGMNARQLSGLFEPFSQADASTTRRFGGTGLGLAISKRLVEMMRGTIGVRSAVGRGSTFDVRVEAPPCDATPAVQRTTVPTLRSGLRVLLAEDGPDNQRLISFYLQRAGIAFEVAGNGRAAVDLAVTAAAAGTPFDLVLMDMQMPEMDGCHATLALRDAGLTTPVLALTAHGTDEARGQSLRAGCREHLVKPVDPHALLAAIAAHTSTEPPAPRRSDNGLSDDPRFKALLAEYVAELPGQVSELVRLSDSPPGEPLRRLLHQIKGAGGGYGLTELSVAAAQAQTAFDQADVDSLAKNVDTLISLMRSVQGYDAGLETRQCSNAY